MRECCLSFPMCFSWDCGIPLEGGGRRCWFVLTSEKEHHSWQETSQDDSHEDSDTIPTPLLRRKRRRCRGWSRFNWNDTKKKNNITSSSPVQSSVILELISNALTRTLRKDGTWVVLILPDGGAGEFGATLCGIEECYYRAPVMILSIGDNHDW